MKRNTFSFQSRSNVSFEWKMKCTLFNIIFKSRVKPSNDLLFLRKTISGSVDLCFAPGLAAIFSSVNGWLRCCGAACLFRIEDLLVSIRVLLKIVSGGEALYIWRRCLWPGWRNSSTKPVRYGDVCYCLFITTVV